MAKRLKNMLYAPIGWALHLLALMPWPVIYAHATVFYFLVYHVVRYRRHIVYNNLKECYPGKSDKERARIERAFYRHFADYFMETIKMLHIGDEEMARRMVFTGTQFIEDALNEGRPVVLYAAHYGNWEWITSVTLNFKEATKDGRFVLGQVYQPLENEWFDRFFLRLRTRFGTQGFPQHHILMHMIRGKRDNRLHAIGFIADQHPLPNDQDHVVRFLNHPTAFVTGPEGIARKLHCAVAYFDVKKTSRGHYACAVTPITAAAENEPEGSITNRYAEMLEHTINRAPQYWLWTHNRWKRPVVFPPHFVDTLHHDEE